MDIKEYKRRHNLKNKKSHIKFITGNEVDLENLN